MTDQSRRAFLKRAAALGLVGGAAPFVMNLAAIGEAAAATASDYKALVCIFLFGGNDYANTVTPYDQARYNLYAGLRGTIAHSRAHADADRAQSGRGAGGRPPISRWRPNLAPLIPLFDAGRLAVVLNVGTLVQPTSKTNYHEQVGAAAAQAVQPQRPAELLAGLESGRRDLGLGRPDRRPAPVRQRQRGADLHQRLAATASFSRAAPRSNMGSPPTGRCRCSTTAPTCSARPPACRRCAR